MPENAGTSLNSRVTQTHTLPGAPAPTPTARPPRAAWMCDDKLRRRKREEEQGEEGEEGEEGSLCVLFGVVCWS